MKKSTKVTKKVTPKKINKNLTPEISPVQKVDVEIPNVEITPEMDDLNDFLEEAVIIPEIITPVPEIAPIIAPVIRKVAKYPGIYPSPTKSEPGRYIANYRKDKKTIKIGFFASEELAHEDKELSLNPPVLVQEEEKEPLEPSV